MDYLLSAPGVTEASQGYVKHLAIGPNPFTHTAHIRFTLSNASRVTIRVYNIVGQLVREITDTDLVQGSHQFIWNGEDKQGRELSSGTYVLSIEINKEKVNRVIVLMK